MKKADFKPYLDLLAATFDKNIHEGQGYQIFDQRDNKIDALSFNQDIYKWCVELIEEEPANFSGNSALKGDNVFFSTLDRVN